MKIQRPIRRIEIPEGLKLAVMHVLSMHRGREQAIGRGALVWQLRTNGYAYHERIVRECIKVLRREGKLICAMPGEDGGYYMATSLQEFDEFDQLEFGAKIADMNETRQAMKKAAKIEYGEAQQLELT